jgi:hypothetical protein
MPLWGLKILKKLKVLKNLKKLKTLKVLNEIIHFRIPSNFPAS